MFLFSSTTEVNLAFVTILLFIIMWIRWRRKKLKIFVELRIPGPPPHFLFGNILEINEKGLLQCQEEWIKKYGPIVGYFHGLKPVLLITENNILKRIFIKDFHMFSERPDAIPLRIHSFLDHIIPASQIMDSILLNQKGEDWKRVRSKLSPIFSANKLKMMIPFVDKVTDVTISILERKARDGEITDVYSLLQCLTLDVISAQAFAVSTNVQKEGDANPLFRSAKTIFDNPISSKIFTFGFCFPEVAFLGMAMNFLKMFFANGFSIPPLEITKLVGKVIEERRKYPEMRKPDLLQSLIDASESEATDPNECKLIKDNESDNTRNESSRNSPHVKEKLTDLEIKSNALVVFLAGYETTSSALAYTIHMLAKHSEYQVEIQKEIDRFVEDKELDYYILSSLQQLERFMMETMRFYPPGITFVLRIASIDVDFGYLRIPKGMEITVPVRYMHFSEDNWEEPEVFDPDRFLLERRTQNHVTNYWVFGIGPRNCLGMRLANITSKVILTKLLRRFSFELPPNPEQANIALTVKHGTMVPEKVLIKVKERKCYSGKKEDKI